MAKESCSQEDLAEIVKNHLEIPGLGVRVLPDVVYGWNAFAMTVPEGVKDIHVKMQRIVEKLRGEYELIERVPYQNTVDK